MRIAKHLAALIAAWGLIGPAQAVLPLASLSFVERVATVGPNEVIDVWMRLSIDPGSTALSFSSNPLSGIDSEDLPVMGQYYDPVLGTYVSSEFVSIDGAYLNTYFSCNDSFTNGCNGTPPRAYSYSFHTSSTPGRPSINFLDSFDLQPGESHDYVFATFTPEPGGAAAGSYRFYGTGVTLNFFGLDAEGRSLTADITLASTCNGGPSDDCAFTRHVTAVPEPSSLLLMVLGLGLVAGLARRRH